VRKISSRRFGAAAFLGFRFGAAAFRGFRFAAAAFLGFRFGAAAFLGFRFAAAAFLGFRFGAAAFLGFRFGAAAFLGFGFGAAAFLGFRFGAAAFLGFGFGAAAFLGFRFGAAAFLAFGFGAAAFLAFGFGVVSAFLASRSLSGGGGGGEETEERGVSAGTTARGDRLCGRALSWALRAISCRAEKGRGSRGRPLELRRRGAAREGEWWGPREGPAAAPGASSATISCHDAPRGEGEPGAGDVVSLALRAPSLLRSTCCGLGVRLLGLGRSAAPRSWPLCASSLRADNMRGRRVRGPEGELAARLAAGAGLARASASPGSSSGSFMRSW
jgi:hypothetical protein